MMTIMSLNNVCVCLLFVLKGLSSGIPNIEVEDFYFFNYRIYPSLVKV